MTAHPSGYLKGCQCERCAAYRQRAREYARAHPEKNNNPQRRKYKTQKQRDYNGRRAGETGQSYYQAHREEVLAKARERYARQRAENPLPLRPPKLASRHRRTRHGGQEEWARMHDAQKGLCYLCLRPLPENRVAIHVDHDHSCCDPGPKGRDTDSCRYCRRGLTHERCNQIWGLAREDADLLRMMAAEGERVRNETRERIAAKSFVQDALL